jgi:hypothetical protein
MKITPIFAPYLYAISYPSTYKTVWNTETCSYFKVNEIGNIDEFKRNFALWTNPLYLYNYFDLNQHYMQNRFWNDLTPTEAARITRKIAIEFHKYIKDNSSTIEKLFHPLINNTTRFKELSKSKTKYDWLRLYAIKIDYNRFLITGGVIKLTNSMNEHECTRNELIKLEKTKNYLIEQGVIDSDSFDETLFEITL